MAAGIYSSTSEMLHVSNFTAQEQHPVSQRQNYKSKAPDGFCIKIKGVGGAIYHVNECTHLRCILG